MKNANTILIDVTINKSRQAWKNCVLLSAIFIIVITENIAEPLWINDINENILNILNLFKSSTIAENIWNANNLLKIIFLNLWLIKIETNILNELNILLSNDESLHWVNFLS